MTAGVHDGALNFAAGQLFRLADGEHWRRGE
jgi:hypothetical protein